jgi:hypothetical protein
MKKLYVRYFVSKNDPTLYDEHFVCVNNCGGKEIQDSIALNAYNMTTFLTAYPNGKVEFVWVG